MNITVTNIMRGAGAAAAVALALTACTPGRTRALPVQPPKPSTTTTTRPACKGDVITIKSFGARIKCDVRPPQRIDVVRPYVNDALWREGFGQDCNDHGGTTRYESELLAVCEGIDY